MSGDVAVKRVQAERRGPGRPRRVPTSRTAGSAREEILNAAARLFTVKGFGATSTHDIASAVGVAQATLYYYFSGKEAIVGELLPGSLRPGADRTHWAEEVCDDLDQPAVLCVLIMLDVQMLTRVPHNVTMLATLPEVASLDAARDYRNAREELRQTYSRVARKVEREYRLGRPRTVGLGDQVMALVETVIALRRCGVVINRKLMTSIAASCLRLCGVHEAAVTFTVAAAEQLLASPPRG